MTITMQVVETRHNPDSGDVYITLRRPYPDGNSHRTEINVTLEQAQLFRIGDKVELVLLGQHDGRDRGENACRA